MTHGAVQPLGLAFDLAGSRCGASRSRAGSFIVRPLPDVGRWTGNDWCLRLHRAAITALVSDRAPGAPVDVAVAVPAWFSMGDRHALQAAIDPTDELAVGFVSSTFAATVADDTQSQSRGQAGARLCIDARRGWSAGLASVDGDRLVEVRAWGCDPWTQGSDLTDRDTCRAILLELLERHGEVGSVIVLDDKDAASAHAIRSELRSIDATRRCQVVTAGRASRLVTKGATMLARSPVRAAGAFAHELMVATGDDENPDGEMLVVAARHAVMPSSSRHTFDLGPSDEIPLYFEVLERRHDITAGASAVTAPATGSVAAARGLVRAQLVRERGYDQTMDVTFGLGANGLFWVGPPRAWQLDWQPGRLHIEADDLTRSDTPPAGAQPKSHSTP